MARRAYRACGRGARSPFLVYNIPLESPGDHQLPASQFQEGLTDTVDNLRGTPVAISGKRRHEFRLIGSVTASIEDAGFFDIRGRVRYQTVPTNAHNVTATGRLILQDHYLVSFTLEFA